MLYRLQGVDRVDTLVICGSGLASMSHIGTSLRVFTYRDLGITQETIVQGHLNEAELRQIGEQVVLFLKGRLHYYEGHSLMYFKELLTALQSNHGLRYVVVTNAAGGNFRETPRILLNEGLLNTHSPVLDSTLHDQRELLELMRLNPSGELLEAFANSTKGDPLWVTGIASCGLYGPTFETPSESTFNLAYGTSSMGMSPSREVSSSILLGLPTIAVTFCVGSTPNFDPDFFNEGTHQEVLRVGALLASNFRAHLSNVLQVLP